MVETFRIGGTPKVQSTDRISPLVRQASTEEHLVHIAAAQIPLRSSVTWSALVLRGVPDTGAAAGSALLGAETRKRTYFTT